jgi:hypothetical protein
MLLIVKYKKYKNQETPDQIRRFGEAAIHQDKILIFSIKFKKVRIAHQYQKVLCVHEHFVKVQVDMYVTSADEYIEVWHFVLFLKNKT